MLSFPIDKIRCFSLLKWRHMRGMVSAIAVSTDYATTCSVRNTDNTSLRLTLCDREQREIPKNEGQWLGKRFHVKSYSWPRNSMSTEEIKCLHIAFKHHSWPVTHFRIQWLMLADLLHTTTSVSTWCILTNRWPHRLGKGWYIHWPSIINN